MPQPPENIEREVRCPHCGELRTTKAQPNTNLRCRNCGQLFKVPRPGGSSAAAPPPPDPPGGPTEPAAQHPGPGPKRVTPKVRPAPPPPQGEELAGDDGTAEGEEATTSPGHDNGGVPPAGEEPAAPEPPAEPSTDPEPPAEPEPEKPKRGARRWRR